MKTQNLTYADNENFKEFIFEGLFEAAMLLTVAFHDDLFDKIEKKSYGNKFISEKFLKKILKEEGFEKALTDSHFPKMLELPVGNVYNSNQVIDYFNQMFSPQEKVKERNIVSPEQLSSVLHEFFEHYENKKEYNIPKELLPAVIVALKKKSEEVPMMDSFAADMVLEKLKQRFFKNSKVSF